MSIIEHQDNTIFFKSDKIWPWYVLCTNLVFFEQEKWGQFTKSSRFLILFAILQSFDGGNSAWNVCNNQSNEFNAPLVTPKDALLFLLYRALHTAKRLMRQS